MPLPACLLCCPFVPHKYIIHKIRVYIYWHHAQDLGVYFGDFIHLIVVYPKGNIDAEEECTL